MALWFHRNPLKATQPLKFDGLKKASKGGKGNEILTQMRANRQRILDLISNPGNTVDDVTGVFNEYIGLLRGLVDAPTGGDSKLRTVTPFKWTNTLGGRVPSVHSDALFELISIVMNIGIWHMKHATHVATTDEITMEEAKEVHRSLKLSAGIFLHIKESLVTRLPASTEKGVDTDSRVIEAYAQQAQAEAQEVTLGRALELGHKPAVMYSLAAETSNLFSLSADALKTLDQVQFGKWITYLQLKAAFYESYAYCFYGKQLLEEEKCGESIRALKHSKLLSDKTIKLCEKYARVKGPGSIARPEHHPFFQKLAPLIKLHLDKSERENGFIYYHKIPEELPELPKKEVFGLATPDDFVLPPYHSSWTEEVYKSFEVLASEGDTKNYDTQASASHEEIAPIPEANIVPGKAPDPKNSSGCIVQ